MLSLSSDEANIIADVLFVEGTAWWCNIHHERIARQLNYGNGADDSLFKELSLWS